MATRPRSGRGCIRACAPAGLRREDVFVTTKVYQDKLAAADFERSFDDSLEEAEAALGRPAAHPLAEPEIAARRDHRRLCKAKREGRAKHVGVANFTTSLLDGGDEARRASRW